MRKLAALLFLIAPTLFAQSVNGIANQTVVGNSAFVAGSGAANVLTACPTPAITSQALTAGLVIHVRPNAANTTTTPTFNLCSLGAVTVVKGSGGSLISLAAGDYATGVDATFYYTGSFWQLMNPQTGAAGIPYPSAGIPNSTGTAWGTSYTAQGTDTKVLTAGTVSGTSVSLCTDANGGATTVSCPSGGGGSGSYVLLGSYTASAAAELDIVTRNAAGQSGAIFQSDYDEYELVVQDVVPATSPTSLGIQYSINGGSTYDTTSAYAWNNYGWITNAAGATGNSSDTNLFLMTSITNTANFKGSGRFTIYNPLGAGFKALTGTSTFFMSANNVNEGFIHTGYYKNTTAVNAFRFIMQSGNIASATVRVYGLAH